MTILKTSKNRMRLAAALAALLSVAAVTVLAQGNGPATKVTATLYSTLDYATGKWVGNAILAIGQEPPVAASYSCEGPLPNQKPGGELYGTETCSFTLADGAGTFDLQNQFTALPDSAPGLYTMHTVSTIANGTGKFSGTSGQLIERAQFVLPGAFGTISVPALGRSEGIILGLK